MSGGRECWPVEKRRAFVAGEVKVIKWWILESGIQEMRVGEDALEMPGCERREKAAVTAEERLFPFLGESSAHSPTSPPAKAKCGKAESQEKYLIYR